MQLIITDAKWQNNQVFDWLALINLPSALIYNMAQLSHSEERKLIPVFNKSLFLNKFHPQAPFHPSISVPVGLLTIGPVTGALKQSKLSKVRFRLEGT